MKARKHYEELSDASFDWFSVIPHAIDSWEREPELLSRAEKAEARMAELGDRMSEFNPCDLNDLNKLYNKAVENCKDEELEQLQSIFDSIEAHILSLEHWKDTALQISTNCGEANADAERLAAEYIKTLSEIGGVWWEDPFERSPALIAHKNRMEKKMIHYFHIYVDIYPYLGESEEVEKCDYGGGGWHVRNHIERNKLLFGKVTDTPKLITGETCLKGELNRIIDRHKSGMSVGVGIKIYPVDEHGHYCGDEVSNDKN